MTRLVWNRVKGFFLVGFMFTGSLAISQDLTSAIRLTRSEQFGLAATTLKKMIAQTPENGDLYYYYGQNFLQEYFSDTVNYSLKEKCDSAIQIFQSGTQKDPGNPLNYVGLAEVAMIKKDMGTAQGHITRVMGMLPSKANKGVVMAPDRHATVLIRLANGYIKAGINDTAQIFGLLRNAEKLDKKNFELYIVRGDAYITLLNDGSKAISSYNLAQTYNPQSPTAKLKIGQLWLRARNYRDAISYYQEVIQIDSTYAPAYRELGFLLSKAGRNEEAKGYFKKFLALSGGNVTARIQYVNTLFEIQDYTEAVNQLNEVYRSDSSNNDLNRALAYGYFETGTYDKGLLYIRKFLAGAPADKIRATDYTYYGRLLAKNKLDSLAPEQLMKAFELDTSKSELITEAAICWTKVKKYDRAVEMFQKKIDLKKAGAMDYYNLGKVYYNLQDFTNADTNLAIFNQLQPDYIQGWVWRARTRSNIDPDSKLGLAKPMYDIIIEKTQTDTVKYVKDRLESFYYLSYYNFLQYNATKSKEFATLAVDYGNRVIAIDPKDDKALKAKQIVDVLKDKVK